MNVLGFSSGGAGHLGNTDRMVQTILDKSGCDSEFVKLTDMTFSGCKGCVDLCAIPQVCRLDDEVGPYYQKIKEADAVVLGSAVYSGSINAIALSFIERFFGYRHVDIPIAGKPFVLVVSGALKLDSAVAQLEKMLGMFEANVINTIRFASQVPPCFKCGRHRECEIGGMYLMLGDAVKEMKITPEMFAQWENDQATVTAIDAAAEKLRNI